MKFKVVINGVSSGDTWSVDNVECDSAKELLESFMDELSAGAVAIVGVSGRGFAIPTASVSTIEIVPEAAGG